MASVSWIAFAVVYIAPPTQKVSKARSDASAHKAPDIPKAAVMY